MQYYLTYSKRTYPIKNEEHYTIWNIMSDRAEQLVLEGYIVEIEQK